MSEPTYTNKFLEKTEIILSRVLEFLSKVLDILGILYFIRIKNTIKEIIY